MDNLEFSDIKSLRKSILVSSLIGIFLVKLVGYSKGTLDFFGFSVPLTEANFLPQFLAFIIIFFLIALLIRFGNEEFQKNYTNKINNISDISSYNFPSPASIEKDRIIKQTKKTKTLYKRLIIFLDIIFPLLFGVITVFYIFIKTYNVT